MIVLVPGKPCSALVMEWGSSGTRAKLFPEYHGVEMKYFVLGRVFSADNNIFPHFFLNFMGNRGFVMWGGPLLPILV